MKALSDQTRVSFVVGVCLLALVILLKNVVKVPAEVLSRDVVLYIIVYWAMGMSPGQLPVVNRSRLDRPLFWSALVVVITAAIVLVYALQR